MEKIALLSVHDKQGIVELAKELEKMGRKIISSGGTADILRKNGVFVTEVSKVTGFPEMLGGRVKTLHPIIHAGILAKRDEKEHMETLQKHDIEPIDIVAVNLYPFEKTIERTEDIEEIIENIDIGGPTLVRAAAKNYKDVIVLTDPKQYKEIVEILRSNQEISLEQRQKLAIKAYAHTAQYDAIIAEYLRDRWTDELFPDDLTIALRKKQRLRHGENPHQKEANLYQILPSIKRPCIINAKQLQGKELSFNNIADANAAINCIKDFPKVLSENLVKTTCVAFKHYTPCGIARAKDPVEAWKNTFATDTESPFGGIVAFDRMVEKDLVEQIFKDVRLLDVIIAPSFSEDAMTILRQKKNLRLLELGLNEPGRNVEKKRREIRDVDGGILAQEYDNWYNDPKNWTIVSKAQPTETIWKTMQFAVICIKHVKSNSVLFVDGEQTVAIAGGQTSRIEATRIATRKGGGEIKGSVMASDAYFPFPDCVELAIQFGAAAIIHPGGSQNDQASIDVANRYGIPMVFSHQRYFKH